MTESEAIKILQRDLEIQVKNKALPDGIEAIQIAIQALEKQLPKKPHKNFEKFSGVWCSCGKYFGKGYFVDKPIYCPNCGQKLDWSDEE